MKSTCERSGRILPGGHGSFIRGHVAHRFAGRIHGDFSGNVHSINEFPQNAVGRALISPLNRS